MAKSWTGIYLLVRTGQPVIGRTAVGAVVYCQEPTDRASLALIRYLRGSQQQFSLNYDRRRQRYLFVLDGKSYDLVPFSHKYGEFVKSPEWWGIPVWEVPRLPEGATDEVER